MAEKFKSKKNSAGLRPVKKKEKGLCPSISIFEKKFNYYKFYIIPRFKPWARKTFKQQHGFNH